MKEIFASCSCGKVFASGTLPNSPEGLYMTESGGMLRWLACKGYGSDWTIYCHWTTSSWEFIKQSGDKITSKRNIMKCLPNCEDIIDLYRY